MKNLTDKQIQEITFKLTSLDYKQREIVRQLLHKLQSGGIGEIELHQALLKLQREFKISEFDRQAIEQAIFG